VTSGTGHPCRTPVSKTAAEPSARTADLAHSVGMPALAEDLLIGAEESSLEGYGEDVNQLSKTTGGDQSASSISPMSYPTGRSPPALTRRLGPCRPRPTVCDAEERPQRKVPLHYLRSSRNLLHSSRTDVSPTRPSRHR
jgi:hypothetical protein